MSTGLVYLTPDRFDFLSKNEGRMPDQALSQEKYHLIIPHLPNIALVFFYSKTCPICAPLFKDYMNLPGTVRGVTFAVANVSADDMRIHKMAAASHTPIRYVPYIAAYLNGKFFMEYRGPKSVEHIAKAAYEIYVKVSSGQEFSQGQNCVSSDGVNGYCVTGYEEDDDVGVCTFDEIYGSGQACSTSGKCYTFGQAYGE